MSIHLRKHTQLTELIVSQEQEIAKLKAEIDVLQKKTALLAKKNEDNFSLKQIIDFIPGHIYWKDRDGKCLGCNNNQAKFLNLNSPDEIVGKYNKELIAEELAEILDKTDQEIMVSGKGRYLEEIVPNPNGKQVFFLTHKMPLFNANGDVVGLLGTSIDITERKKIEQELKEAKDKAESSDKAKSQFLSVINHELRTPLTGILGLTQLFQQNQLTADEQKEAIEDMANCSQHLLNLVNNVLDFNRLEAKKYPPNLSLIDLKQLMNEVFSILAILAKNKGLELHAHFSQHIPQLILTDPLMLRQILINLANNAIKFTDKGHVTIEVRVLQQTSNKIKLEIAIHDSGCGIPADKIATIFEPFQQLEDTHTRSSSRSGTGLGLAIVKNYAELLDLNIKVKSELDKGSTFSLIGNFVIQQDQHMMPYNKIKLQNIPFSLPEKIKVLIVEDDRIIQRIHQKMLIELGCIVDIATSGQEALEKFSDHHIAFVDIGLPDMPGFEVIKSIRQYHNKPIIALTGYTGDEEKESCYEAGADEIANKPIAFDDLKQLLMDHVGK